MAGSEDIPEIVITRQGAEIARRRLSDSPLQLGRDYDNDLVLDDPSVIGKHAVIVLEQTQWWIRGLDNRPRLRVADKPCQSHPLSHGDRVGLGMFELEFLAASCPTEPQRDDVALGRTRVFDDADSLDLAGAEPASPDLEIPGYQILGEIGRGGMGRVFRAVQISTRRTVALKIMLEGPVTSEKTKRRFEREVHIVASLRHPNIAQIYESGLHQGRYWFAMEYVDGKPLDAREVTVALSLRDRLALMAKVCEAVGHAHAQTVVHRDLKPTNILISDDGEPHVLDFGLAKIEDPDGTSGMVLSMAGELMGTPAYMSPEQTERDPSKVDVRADVYSLGVILYQFLTGAFPYDVRGRLDEVIRHIATTDPARPSQIRKEIDDEVEAIILKAIAKRPEERYLSAKEMGQDLRRLLAGEPVEAKLTSRTYVLSKTFARQRGRLLLVGVVAAAVIVSVLATRAWLAPGRPSRPGEGLAAKAPDKPDAPTHTPQEARLPQAVRASAPTTETPSTVIAIPLAADDKTSPTTGSTPTTRPAATIVSPPSRPAVTPSPTTRLRGPAASRPTPQTAEALLARLKSCMEHGDPLRARLALERLESRFADDPDVVASADELAAARKQIDRRLPPGAVQDNGPFLVHTGTASAADWQIAMGLAQEIFASEPKLGLLVVRVMLENEEAETAFEIEGHGVAFYGKDQPVTAQRVRSGDLLFVGSKSAPGPTSGITLTTRRHGSPTIRLAPNPGEVKRLGDFIVREKHD